MPKAPAVGRKARSVELANSLASAAAGGRCAQMHALPVQAKASAVLLLISISRSAGTVNLTVMLTLADPASLLGRDNTGPSRGSPPQGQQQQQQQQQSSSSKSASAAEPAPLPGIGTVWRQVSTPIPSRF